MKSMHITSHARRGSSIDSGMPCARACPACCAGTPRSRARSARPSAPCPATTRAPQPLRRALCPGVRAERVVRRAQQLGPQRGVVRHHQLPAVRRAAPPYSSPSALPRPSAAAAAAELPQLGRTRIPRRRLTDAHRQRRELPIAVSSSCSPSLPVPPPARSWLPPAALRPLPPATARRHHVVLRPARTGLKSNSASHAAQRTCRGVAIADAPRTAATGGP